MGSQCVFRNFLKVLVDPENSDVDIIAVHGLNPTNTEFHAEATWTAGDKLWLRDFLPKQLPNARILLFGYNANVAFETSIAGVKEHAVNLLNRIASKREDVEERPIVFVAHSLGGIVVKRALVEAKLDDSYRSIREATHGIAFFGTPHQGGNSAKLGDIAASIVRGILRNPPNTFMEALKKDSLFSNDIVEDFRHSLEDYYVVSFFETLPMGRFGLIVDKKSATLGLPGLRERQIPMEADHAGVCKYTSADGDDYEQVSFNLVRLVKSAVKAVAERARIAALSVPSSMLLSEPAWQDLKKEKALFLVPFDRDDHFIGREDILSEIDKKLKAEQRVALVGIGGVGKSQIAIEYCYRYKSNYSNSSVLWVHASTVERFDQAYQDIARRHALPGWNDPKANKLQIVYDWLSNEECPEWLMILDNADDEDMFFKDQKGMSSGGAASNQRHLSLSIYLPQTSNGSILVTSRNRMAGWKLTNRNERIVDIPRMNEEDAKILLCKRLPKDEASDNKPSDNDTADLVKTLEYLPLAITQAASYISVRRTRMTTASYLAYLRQNEAILLKDTGDLRRDPSMPNSVILTWQISFDLIKKRHPEAADLLSLMSVLDRQGIPEFLLCDDDNRLDFEDALAPLNDFSLITSESECKSLGMHRLVQIATRAWLKSHNEIEKWNQEAVRLMSESFPSGEYENWEICRALLPHAEAVLRYQYSDKSHLLLQADVLYSTAWYSLQQGNYGLALDRSQQALSTRCRFLGEENITVLASNDSHALMLGSLGQYRNAEELYRRTLTLREKVLGKENPLTLTNMDDLAKMLTSQGKCDNAKEMHQHTLTLMEKVLGKENPLTLTCMTNLAVVLNYQGKHDKAEKLHWQTLTLTEKVLGKENQSTLRVMNNLALVLKSQGNHDEAKEMHQQTLVLREKVLGKENPDTLVSMNNLAGALEIQGKYDEAEAMRRQTSSLMEKVLGKKNPNTIMSMQNLAGALRNQGKYDEAEKILWQTISLSENVLGEENPLALKSMSNLAGVLESQGKYDEAEKMHRQTLSLTEKVLGKKHALTLINKGNLASLLKE